MSVLIKVIFFLKKAPLKDYQEAFATYEKLNIIFLATGYGTGSETMHHYCGWKMMRSTNWVIRE